MPSTAPRIVVGMTGASGAIFGVEFLKRCPGQKYLILSRWGRAVLYQELGLSPDALTPYAHRIFANEDLAAPFASGSNPFDTFIVIPCSVTTLGKIAAGIGDTLITRTAEVALKERRRLVLAIRETPLSSIALENALKLSREGVVIMPLCPPFYQKPTTLEEVVRGFVDKVFGVLGVPTTQGWHAHELE